MLFQFFLLLVLVSFSAFFSGSETALFSLSRARLLSYREDTKAARRYITDLMSTYNRTLIALVLGNMFVNIGISIVGNEILSNLQLNEIFTILVSIIVVVILLLTFGEVTPKAIALAHAEKISETIAKGVWYFRFFLSPFILVIEKCSSIILDLLGRKKSAALSQEEYSSYVDMAYSIGAFSDKEAALFNKIFSLRESKVSKIVKGRIDLSCVRYDMSATEILSIITEKCEQFYPVIRKTIDDAEAFLSSKDFFAIPEKERDNWQNSPCILPAVFIPENSSLTTLLTILKGHPNPIAFAVDEYGGITGVLNLENIYEEIVGEIEDEYDVPEWQIKKTGTDSWKLNGQIPLDDLKELINWSCTETEANTLNGLFSEKLDRIPVSGDKITLNGVELTVLAVSQNRVNEAEIKLLKSAVANTRNSRKKMRK